jgi:hypothetical protein
MFLVFIISIVLLYVLLDVQLHVINALTMVLCCIVIRSNCFVFLSSVCIQCESVRRGALGCAKRKEVTLDTRKKGGDEIKRVHYWILWPLLYCATCVVLFLLLIIIDYLLFYEMFTV